MVEGFNGERGRACPRCGTRMEYWVEMESGGDGARRVKYYYKCPRCGYRVFDAVVTVRRVDGFIVLEKEEFRVVGGGVAARWARVAGRVRAGLLR